MICGTSENDRGQGWRERGNRGFPDAAGYGGCKMTKLQRICCFMAVIALLTTVAPAQDKKHEAQLRTVRGVVTDKSDNPLNGSVVFLKNMRTNSVRSSYTDDTGSYRFSGLDPNADYELHAEKENEKSTTRTVSSFDSRKDIVLNLKIGKKKS